MTASLKLSKERIMDLLPFLVLRIRKLVCVPQLALPPRGLQIIANARYTGKNIIWIRFETQVVLVSGFKKVGFGCRT